MARKPKESTVSGRALVDIPSAGLKCGEYADIDADIAEHLIAAGAFDDKAVKPASGDDDADE